MEANRELSGKQQELIRSRLQTIYGSLIDEDKINALLDVVRDHLQLGKFVNEKWNERDILLITYGDSIIEEGIKPLSTLADFLHKNLKDSLSTVHILPFFPYTSDDGFSVVDYFRVDPQLGDWDDIGTINRDFDLMMDLVINHISQKSEWFQNYLRGKHPGRDYFIEVDPHTDLSQVVRPRSKPLLTAFRTNEGEKHVWTTFSEDQIDLNFSNPDLLIEMMKVLMFYLKNGARIIRLDAIAYLWKEIGTSCIHLPQTHEVVKLMRDITEMVKPDGIILTETNVPNEENLSYFGDGDEAHMIYQFSLPPLLLHALHKADSRYLNDWVSRMPDPGQGMTYLNFTASHDGIGVRPLEGILPEAEKEELLNNMREFGGKISTKRNADGSESPYEINITYFDALKHTADEVDDFQIERFICSQTIMMTLQGIPAFYIHSLFGTPNDYEGLRKTQRSRTINRKKWNREELEGLLAYDTSYKRVFDELRRLAAIRRNEEAFHPDNSQKIINMGSAFFIVLREDHTDEGDSLVSISNITHKEVMLGSEFERFKYTYKDLMTGMLVNDLFGFVLQPYQSLWLKPV
ncbi:MAG: sugar phosphorylase [Bacteroidales bacterium]|nr:sugar phosphorylase [Bacteroidales bacterium]